MSLYSWGANSHGQLSLGSFCEQVERPEKVKNDFLDNLDVQQIACGGGHSLLIDSEGKLYSCGWNLKLQCGNKKKNANLFQRVWEMSGITFTHVACGWDFSCGITNSQFLFVWGSNSHGQLGLPKGHFSDTIQSLRLQVNASAVSMGLRHTAIINSVGDVWITGCGKHGQLGLGSDIISSDRFQKVSKIGKISNIACGQNHTLAWSSDEHAIYVWGDNKHGQLILTPEKYKKVFVPHKIDIDVRQGVKKLLSGWTNALLWLEDGTLLTWGRNNYGQLGTNSPFVGKLINIKLPEHRQVKDIALGSEHTICLATDNTLWAWGWNEHSNTGTTSGEVVFLPTQVHMDNNSNTIIRQIYTGGASNFIVTENPKNKNANQDETKL